MFDAMANKTNTDKFPPVFVQIQIHLTKQGEGTLALTSFPTPSSFIGQFQIYDTP